MFSHVKIQCKVLCLRSGEVLRRLRYNSSSADRKVPSSRRLTTDKVQNVGAATELSAGGGSETVVDPFCPGQWASLRRIVASSDDAGFSPEETTAIKYAEPVRTDLWPFNGQFHLELSGLTPIVGI